MEYLKIQFIAIFMAWQYMDSNVMSSRRSWVYRIVNVYSLYLGWC